MFTERTQNNSCNEKNSDWLKWIVNALATWRLAHMLMYEQGPLKVLQYMREELGVEHDADGVHISYTGMGAIFSCFWCFSIWVAMLGLPKPIARVLALSAVAIWIEEHYGNSH
jgi:hypothetical protein